MPATSVIAAVVWCSSDFISQCEVWNLQILLDFILLQPLCEMTNYELAATLAVTITTQKFSISHVMPVSKVICNVH